MTRAAPPTERAHARLYPTAARAGLCSGVNVWFCESLGLREGALLVTCSWVAVYLEEKKSNMENETTQILWFQFPYFETI